VALSRWLQRWSVWIVIVILGIGAALNLRNDWTPILDIAAMEIRIQAMPEMLPTVGVFSRLGWYHPGPAIFYQSWLPYDWFGPIGMNVAMVSVHLLALLAAWWVAKRLDRLAGALMLLGIVVLLFLLPPLQPLEPWNPYSGTVASVTLIVSAWSLAQRDWPGALLVLPLGSYLMHNHLGYVPFVGAVVLTALVLGWWPTQQRRFPWRALLIGVVIALVMWAPVIWQQITGDPGNIAALINATGSEPAAGIVHGFQTVGAAYGISPYWADASVLVLPNTWSIPWLLVVVVVATAAAVLRRDGIGLRGLAVCVAANVAAVIAVASASGILSTYLMVWLPATAVSTLVLSIWVLLRALPTPESGLTIAYVGAGAVTIATSVTWAGAAPAYPDLGRASSEFGSALASEASGQPVYLTNSDARGFTQKLDIRQVFYGTLASALRQGADVAVPESIVWEVDGALPIGPESRPEYAVTVYTGTTSDVIAVWNPLDIEQFAQFDRISNQLAVTAPGSEQEAALLEAQQPLIEGGRLPMALVRLGERD
jgi:hypothetical protein